MLPVLGRLLYNGDQKSRHPNNRTIRIADVKVSAFQIVHYSNAQYNGARYLNNGPAFKWLSE